MQVVSQNVKLIVSKIKNESKLINSTFNSIKFETPIVKSPLKQFKQS